MISQSHFWICTQRTQNQDLKETLCTSMFSVALFTVDKVWKQPECPSADE